MKQFRFFLTSATLLLFAVSATMSHGAGFQLFNELSAKSMATGAAMSARDDVAECAWFNPAGSSMMNRASVTSGMAVVFPSMELDTGNDDPDMKNMAYAVPYLYASMPFMEQFGASISINSPYGLTTEWDNDWVGKYYAQYTRVSSIYITPSFSWRPVKWLSLGAGAQLVYADAEMRKYIPVTKLGTEVYTKIKGDDWGQGYILSAMLKPTDKWTFGITFRSQVDLDLDGDARYEYPQMPEPYNTMLRSVFLKSDLALPLSLPETLSIAMSTTALDNWRFSAEFLWTGWSSYSNLNFKYDNMPGQGATEGSVKYEKDWNDVWSIHLGAEYALTDSVTLRGSYVWDDSPIEDDYRDPSLPTNDRHIFSLGAGWKWGHMEFDGAYSCLFVEDSKPGKKATPTLHGTYEGTAHIVNFSFTWNF